MLKGASLLSGGMIEDRIKHALSGKSLTNNLKPQDMSKSSPMGTSYKMKQGPTLNRNMPCSAVIFAPVKSVFKIIYLKMP